MIQVMIQVMMYNLYNHHIISKHKIVKSDVLSTKKMTLYHSDHSTIKCDYKISLLKFHF